MPGVPRNRVGLSIGLESPAYSSYEGGSFFLAGVAACPFRRLSVKFCKLCKFSKFPIRVLPALLYPTECSSSAALTESYLAVEQMRFGDRLKVLLELAPGTTEAMVPTLLLQPLVENAIRHGLRNIAENGVIAIRSEISAQRLVLTVTDNGSGVCCSSLEELDLGIGLASTRDRLAGMYKQDGLLAIAGRSQGGTEVRLTLPLRMAPHETPTYEQAAAAHCG